MIQLIVIWLLSALATYSIIARRKYYFYHITFYRLSDGVKTGISMGHVYNRFLRPIDPLIAYEGVRDIAIRDCPSDSTWSIDLVQRNK